VSDIQGAEFPVFAHLAESGLASRIDTVSTVFCHVCCGKWTRVTSANEKIL
jgi:hypothetical protein